MTNRKWLLVVMALVVALGAAPVWAASAPAAGEHAAEHHGNWFLENGGLIKVIVVQVVGFVLLFLALKKWAFPVIAGALNDRVAKIKDTYEKLDAEKTEIERLTRAMQERLAGIEKEAAAKVDAAVRDGNAQKASILAEAQAAAARVLAKAKGEIEVERAKAIEEIRQEMVRLSLEAAEKLVKQQLTAAKHEELVERFISELEKVKA